MSEAVHISPRRKGIGLDTVTKLFPTPEPVAAEPPLFVHRLTGRNKRLVISFARVGTRPREVPAPIFVGTSSNYGENHVLFFADDSRSWLNGDGLAQQIVEIVEAYRTEHDIEEVVTLGNSMGGFSAIVLAELIHVDRVIAFGPQYSMRSEIVPEETRWRRYFNAIKSWRFDSVGGMSKKDTTYYIVHGDREGEMDHWHRFPRNKMINHYIVQNAGHRLPTMLRKRKRLKPLMLHAFEGRTRRFRENLERSFGPNFHAFQRRTYEMEFLGDQAEQTDMAGSMPASTEGQT